MAPALIRRASAAAALAVLVVLGLAGPAGADLQAKWVTTAEDFAHYRDVAPILFAHVGATPDFTDYASAPVNHSPQFTVDEAVLPVGVRMHVLVALTYLQDHVGAAAPKAR